MDDYVILENIGEGSFGKVYKVVRSDIQPHFSISFKFHLTGTKEKYRICCGDEIY